MLRIRVPGYGIVQDPRVSEFTVYIVQIEQPTAGWTIYRRYGSFRELAQQMSLQIQGLPPCPPKHLFEAQTPEFLNQRRMELNDWLQALLMIPDSLRCASFQEFLATEPDLPPPGLNVTWCEGRAQRAATTDEMDMEEVMFGEHGSGAPSPPQQQQQPPPANAAPPAAAATPAPPAAPSHHHQQPPAPQAQQAGDEDMEGLIGGRASRDPELLRRQQHMAAMMGLMSGGGGDDDDDELGLDDGECFAALETEQQGIFSFEPPSAMQMAAPRVSLDAFQLIRVIGKGSFGKVVLVRKQDSGEVFAMKILKKDAVVQRNQVEHTRTERQVMGYVKHPFIVGLRYAFQTRSRLHLVLDYCNGGELFFHLGNSGKFSEARSRFYASMIVLALQHVHRYDVVYRDLKPENVLVDGDGYIRLTDFGLSKEGISENTHGAHSFCGTPEYLAPEILNRQGHGRAVDWWSLGALLYEMLTGLPPFYSRDREQLFEKIRRGTLKFPRYLSGDARDILTGLLTRDPAQRLGSGPTDAEEIKAHPFFAPIDWDRLYARELEPPWNPPVVGSLDTSQFDTEFTSMPVHSPETGLGVSVDDDTFRGFSYVDNSALLRGPGPPGGAAGAAGAAAAGSGGAVGAPHAVNMPRQPDFSDDVTAELMSPEPFPGAAFPL